MKDLWSRLCKVNKLFPSAVAFFRVFYHSDRNETGADTQPGSHLQTHPQQLLRKVPTLVDAAVHGDEALGSRLVSHVVVVQAGVEHDDGKGQHIACVCNKTQGGEA